MISHVTAEHHAPLATPGELPSWRVLLDAIRDGSAPPPPAASLIGLELVSVASGETVFRFRPSPAFGNPTRVHGGVLAMVADFAATTAIATVAPPGADIVTSDLHLSFVRSVSLDAPPLRCVGTVAHIGRTQANADAVLFDHSGRLALRAVATCRLRDADPFGGSWA